MQHFDQILLNFNEISPEFHRNFTEFAVPSLKFRCVLPYPDPIRNRRSSAGIWSRSVCCPLASNCARPAAALRDKYGQRKLYERLSSSGKDAAKWGPTREAAASLRQVLRRSKTKIQRSKQDDQRKHRKNQLENSE